MLLVPIPTYKDLMRRATPEQILAARDRALRYFIACRLDGLNPERAEQVMRESLEIELLEAQEEPVEYDDAVMTFTRRNYSAIYSSPDELDGRTVSMRAERLMKGNG
jgi:hypothetical protein